MLSVTAADQLQTHELTYKMMLLLIVAACGQLTLSVTAAAVAYCAAVIARKVRKYVGHNRGYNHNFCSLLVPQVTVT